MTTGLRLGEATGVRWADIDFDTPPRLRVRRALQRQRQRGLVFVEPKTRSSRRTVRLPLRAVDALRKHRIRQLEQRLMAGSAWEDEDLVFCTATGRPIDPAQVRLALHATLACAGLPPIRFHDFRHTAATLLLMRGLHPKLVQEMLGHSTISLTLDTYSHVLPEMHGAAAHEMDAILATLPSISGPTVSAATP